MSATAIELATSRELTGGAVPQAVYHYVIKDTDDDMAAYNAMLAAAPATHANLVAVSARVKPHGPNLWQGSVTYGKAPRLEPGATGEVRTSFDVAAQAQHIQQDKATTQTCPAGTAPDCRGAIGATADGVEGCGVLVPQHSLCITKYIPAATVTEAWIASIAALVGQVNTDAFKGFDAGEVLFTGFSGAQRGSADWEITFRFAISKNCASVPGFTQAFGTIPKKGWEYLDVRYKKTLDSTAQVVVQEPLCVYIHQVYDTAAFSVLGL